MPSAAFAAFGLTSLALAAALPTPVEVYNELLGSGRHHRSLISGGLFPFSILGPKQKALTPVDFYEEDAIDSQKPVGPGSKDAELYVTVSFYEVPAWPKSGLQELRITLPVGEFWKADEIPELPLRPDEARLAELTTSNAEGDRIAGTDAELAEIECWLTVSHEIKESGKSSRFIPIDGQSSLKEPQRLDLDADEEIEKFGCQRVPQ